MNKKIINNVHVEKTLDIEIDLDEVKRAYNGRVGCMCGCLGRYSSNKATIKKTFNKIVELVKQGKSMDIGYRSDSIVLYYYVETGRRSNEDRCHCLYMKE